jgi:PAS domain S-box-containing protein
MMPDTPASVERMLALLAGQSEEHAIVLLDRGGNIIWWNHGAETIFGQPVAEAVGQPLSQLFVAEDVRMGIPQYEAVAASHDAAAEDDRWMARADGSRFWAAGSMIALRDEDGEVIGYGKIIQNRTDIKQQLETLRNRTEALARADEQKNVFLSTLSHELRNPLAPLANAIEFIRIAAPDNPRLQSPIRIMQRQLDALRRLVDDLLDVTRIGAGKLQLDRTLIDLREVIEQAVEMTRPLIEQRKQTLEVLAQSTAVMVEGDPSRLRQVFVNLITNAAKYTPEGGRVWVKLAVEGAEAAVRVEDDGAGISPEVLPHIFELFTQAESALPHSQGGLGIGLSLVKNLVTLHGGSVQARSDGDGKGSVFTVRLPVVPV